MLSATKHVMSGFKKPVEVISQSFANTAFAPGVSAHENGDLLIMWVGNWNGTPTKPSPGGTVPNWIDLSVTSQGRWVYCFGTGSTTAGDWSNYGYHYRAVLRNATRVGAYSFTSGYYGVAVPELSLSDSGGSSLILVMAAAAANGSWIIPSLPSGWNYGYNGGASTTGNFSIYSWSKPKARNGNFNGSSYIVGSNSICWAIEACA